jgi:EvpB/VC_A0108, tail sheath N-terminal domain
VNELNLAVEPPAVSTRPDVVAPAVRDAMLSGRFVGSRDPDLADQIGGFLASPPGEAVDMWFGAERGARLRIDHQALRDAIDRDIAAIDAMLSEQVDAILHHARLRKLEGTWRGIAWLVEDAELSNRLKIKILNVGWPEICRDLERAIEFDQSLLFRKV